MIYYLYKDTQQELTCDSASTGILDAFSRGGCKVLSESEFLDSSIIPNHDDVIIIYISLKNEDCHNKLQSTNCRKILHSMDESKSDEILFRTQLEFCRRHRVDTMINTFPSKRNIDFLSSNGISTITMPFCGSPREIDFSKKDIDILVSGQINEKYYPIRCKILSALKKSDIRYAYLQHSGIEASKVIHQYHGKNFHNLLDRCWLGVTCRAGSFRDRLVPKYVEFGFSKVLAVGDCPTYIDPDMESSMVVVTEDSTHEEIITNIKNTLSDRKELIQRIERYSSIVHKNHDMDINVRRVLFMINNHQLDTAKYENSNQ